MKSILREHISRVIKNVLENREYQLKQLSPKAYDVLGPQILGIPRSAVIDIKIIKAPKPIFKCFLSNGHSFNIIDNEEYMQADINRILFDLDRDDDIRGAKYELEKLMQKGNLTQGGEEESSEDLPPEVEPTLDEPAEEPEA